MRGFFAIGSEYFTHRCNLGTLFRSAYSLGAQYVYRELTHEEKLELL